MSNISANTLTSNYQVASSSVNAALPAVTPDDGTTETTGSTTSSGSTTVSILARQLSDAAMRAEARPGQKNADLLGPITDNKYFADKAAHDVETPSTSSPELLTRARQATGFINGSDSNPFNGLARDQLSLIAHDDGGSFTINERRAAWEAMQSTASPAASSPNAIHANGRAIMVSRLFGGSEPPVALPPATLYNIAQKSSEFLNHDDRALVSEIYAYAQAEGVDLYYVDRLVTALGTYRNYSDGRQLGSGNIGSYDLEGFKVTYDFKPDDSAIASRILSSSAISSTRIDQGFLRYVLDPGHGAFMNVGGIPFLERLVNKFSSEGADQPPLGSEFATFQKVVIEDHVVRITHKDIRLPPSEALTEVTNGVWSLTELGKAAGYTLDKAGGLSKPIAAPDDEAQQPLVGNILTNGFPDFHDQPTTRRLWPGNLFNLLRNFRS